MKLPTARDEVGLALDAAERAGDEIARLRAMNEVAITRKAHGELVTSADLAADDILRRRLLGGSHATQVLSEEGEASAMDWAKPVWILDPIDGTVNYVHGSSQVAVSVALAVNGAADVGVVYAPFRAETFLAVAGEGAWMRSRDQWRPLSLPTPPRLADALVGTGFPHDRSDLAPLLQRLGKVLRTCRDVRRLGSPCLDIFRVATGQLDIYYETVFPWDAAAASLVAREAGARTGVYAPTPGVWPPALDGENLVAAHPDLFPQFAALLRSE